MDFFRKKDTRSYFSELMQKAYSEIDSMSDSEVTSCDFQEWCEYLISKYSVMPITLFEDNISRSISEIKVKQRNIFAGHPYEPDYYEVDGIRITFHVLFDGTSSLFELQPSSYILSRFSGEHFKFPNDEQCGSFDLYFDFVKSELENQSNLQEYVNRRFENEFSSYRQMVSNVNTEVENFNKGMYQLLMDRLQKRKNKASSFAAISDALCIPLKQNSNAPNVVPVPLKRVKRVPSSRPAAKPVIPESCISDADYENINNIITMCGTTMEKTARTYYANNEEELRDHLLAALNTHYDIATGETFRKIGKSDINIEFDNKAAYIGECKIWHGDKLFRDAVQQVLNYSTLRDVKVSVIIFNKENQNFPGILERVGCWAKECAQTFSQPQANVWRCRYHRSDANIDIDLTVMVFDLYVDKSQFKDSRF